MKPSFQDIIQRLHAFWSAQGCLLWQPYSEKVGAGTMNPATVLGVLGEGEWKVAYIEPSYRPDDGRFGENPNRMQMHTQYQVILKPDPGDPQELYLKSLEALGITSDRHDIRFVEDNWESPALGAWGLGWEVWLDGLEITQFTYFQQAAGQSLTLPAVEITYGLERIAMFLQKVRSVWDLDWNGSASYRDVLLARRSTTAGTTSRSRASSGCWRCTASSRRRRGRASRRRWSSRRSTTSCGARTRSTCWTPAGPSG